MNREILFRGKRTDNGEWVYGSFVNVFRENPFSHVANMSSDMYFIVETNGKIHEVDKETVCQYTGLTDKNGRKIWENDIVRAGGGVLGIVKFGKYGDMKTDYGFYIEWDKTQPYWRNDICYWQQETEVIGNIFDNQELLEVDHE